MVSKKTWWVLLALLWVSFWIKGISLVDPDFGWHLTMGKVISVSGIPKTDPFSYTMANFAFIDHEWLTNWIWYWIYPVLKEPGMSAVYALMAIATLVVTVRRKDWEWASVPVVLAAAILIVRTGVRPQVESWLMLAILWRWWSERRIWEKYRVLAPVMFCVWANLHGGFALGVFLLAAMIGARTIQERKLDVWDVGVWGLGLVATCINPYGTRLWYEVWMQMSDSSLHSNISEWLPFFASVELGFWFLLALVVGLGSKMGKRLPWWQWAVAGGLLLSGLAALRQMALFAVVAVPMVVEMWKTMVKELKPTAIVKRRLKIFLGILLGIATLIWGWNAVWIVGGVAAGKAADDMYPVKAVEYLKSHQFSGNMFSDYAWGGYLIWKYPEKKVFIDGRMPSWRYGVWPFASEPAFASGSGETRWAFKDYMKIVDKRELGLLSRYNVTVVLWHAETKINENWLITTLKKMKVLNNNPTGDKFVKSLLAAGWGKIYDDGKAAIYEKESK
jgi:hypothetical protein